MTSPRFRALLFLFFLLVTYTIGDTVQVAWDDPNIPRADSYVVTLVRQVTNEQFSYPANSPQISIAVPKSGKYEVRVQCMRGAEKSAPCSSLDAGCAQLKTGEKGDWIIYRKPASATGPLVVD